VTLAWRTVIGPNTARDAQRVMNKTIFAKAGAVADVIWGLLHLQAA
jgi:hypothetical protein